MRNESIYLKLIFSYLRHFYCNFLTIHNGKYYSVFILAFYSLHINKNRGIESVKKYLYCAHEHRTALGHILIKTSFLSHKLLYAYVNKLRVCN